MLCEYCKNPDIKVYENCFGMIKILCEKCLNERFERGLNGGWNKK